MTVPENCKHPLHDSFFLFGEPIHISLELLDGEWKSLADA